MHPEIRRDRPGNCPICGMALEPMLPSLEDDDNPELRNFTRRFWWTLPLTLVVTLLAMIGPRLGLLSAQTQSWVELVLSLPVVLWAAAPFFERGAQSIVNRAPNMWTLIALGTGAAFKASTPEALQSLRDAGMRLVMATGDGLTTAKAVGGRLGIDEVHGEVKPADKLALVEDLQRKGGIVARFSTSPMRYASDLSLFRRS